MAEKERQVHTVETREAYARQELQSKLRDLQNRFDDVKDSLMKTEADYKFGQTQLAEMREKLHKAEVQVQAFNLVRDDGIRG